MLPLLRDNFITQMENWVAKNLQRISSCNRMFMPLHNGVHWALGVYDTECSTIVLFDSFRGFSVYDSEIHLLRMISSEVYAKLETKGNWREHWSVVSNPNNVLKQENGDDCGVFLCIHAALYHLRGANATIPTVVRQKPKTWRSLLHSCLVTKTLDPLQAAFDADVILE